MRLIPIQANAADLCQHEHDVMLRFDADADPPHSWHLVATVHDRMMDGVYAITIAFADGTPDRVFNNTDAVEYAILDTGRAD